MKKFTMLTMTGILAIVLAGCGTTADPKTTFVNAHKVLETESTYHFDADVKMQLKATPQTDEEKLQMEMMNKMTMKLTGNVDNKAQKSEYTIDANIPVGGMDFNISMPMYLDQKAKKVYMRGDKIPFLAMNPEIQGKLIEGEFTEDMNQTVDAETYNKLDAKSFTSTELTQEEKDKGGKQKVTVQLDEATAQKLYENYMSKGSAANGMAGQLQNAKIKAGSFVSLTSGDQKPITDDIDLTMVQGANETNVKIHVDYSKFGEPLTFNIDPSNETIIKSEDLQMMGTENSFDGL